MNVLVVAAHPDDEVLGCGATIAKHTQQGDSVYILILAEGVTSRAQQHNRKMWQSELSSVATASKRAGEILGATSVALKEFPDNRMDGCELLDVVKTVEESIFKYQPEVIYTHHIGDVNIDHQYTHRAVVTACRPVPQHPVKTLLFFEVPSSTEWQPPGSSSSFVPNWYVDIRKTLDLKCQALEAYATEMRQWPHPRSIEAVNYLAKWRGCCVGIEAAEAFILGRHLS